MNNQRNVRRLRARGKVYVVQNGVGRWVYPKGAKAKTTTSTNKRTPA